MKDFVPSIGVPDCVRLQYLTILCLVFLDLLCGAHRPIVHLAVQFVVVVVVFLVCQAFVDDASSLLIFTQGILDHFSNLLIKVFVQIQIGSLQEL